MLKRLRFGSVLHLILGSTGICLWDQGFIAAFRERSSADPTISHMLGPAVLAPLDRAAVTRGHFRTDRQVLQSRKGYKYSCGPVILKPILNHQQVISTHVFSMFGLASAVFLVLLSEEEKRSGFNRRDQISKQDAL